jgi:hypothetical protein
MMKNLVLTGVSILAVGLLVLGYELKRDRLKLSDDAEE